MRAFVSGGSGFVGRHLIAALVARGDDVRALARSDRAAATVAEHGAEPVVGDLSDAAVLADAMDGCDWVFHAAAKVTDWGPPEEFYEINVRGTERMLAGARAAEVACFVHVGTEAVLVGGGPIVNVDETRPRPERPIGLYPTTKGLAEARVVAADSATLRTVVVRPRLIWGEDDTSLLPQVVEAVQRGDFRWIGGGRYLTSTCHVDNVAEGALLAAERGRGGEIYFLTDGAPIEMRTFLTALLSTKGIDPGDRSLPRWAAGAMAWTLEAIWRGFRIGKPIPITRSAVHLIGEEVTVRDDKARAELGYEAHVDRTEALRAMGAAGDL